MCSRRSATSATVGTASKPSFLRSGHPKKKRWPNRQKSSRLPRMPFYTPLRYPGGKRRLAQAIMRLLVVNGRRDVDYFEPYAGGAAIALALLFEEYASTAHINDLSRPVYAFWHSAINE